MTDQVNCVLTIGGSDCSAGAGVQADLKTFGAYGVYGLTAVTCVVAEVPGKVSSIQSVDAAIVAEQIRLLFECFPITALKTGLLHSSAVVHAVCDSLEEAFRSVRQRPFLVVDPVMVATSGHALLDPEAIKGCRDRLFSLAGLVTPNLDEAGVLLGRPIATLEQMHIAVRELAATWKTGFLLKGGHLKKGPATDLLCSSGAVQELSSPFVEGVSTHGTGCTYSAAIAAGIARGLVLEEAVAEGKRFVTSAIRDHLHWTYGGRSTQALNHAVDEEGLTQRLGEPSRD